MHGWMQVRKSFLLFPGWCIKTWSICFLKFEHSAPSFLAFMSFLNTSPILPLPSYNSLFSLPPSPLLLPSLSFTLRLPLLSPPQLVLGYLPPMREQWGEELSAKRAQYAHFTEELLKDPVGRGRRMT